MTRRSNPLPTHGFLLFNKATNWLSGIFLFVVLVVFISAWTIRYSINRDCHQVYVRDVKILGYWMHVESGSTKQGCPQP